MNPTPGQISRRKFIQGSGSLMIYFALPGCAGDDNTAAVGAGQQQGNGALSVSNWIKLSADGSVTLTSGKVEIGQGIGTALAQIAAEELQVDFSRIRLSAVDTNYSPNQSYTFSSISVQQSGSAVRQAVASGRQYLLQMAARELSLDKQLSINEKLAVDSTRLSVKDGVFYLDGAATDLSYWHLLSAQQHAIATDEQPSYRPTSDYRVVGQPIQRIDIPGKVFGHPSFLQDLRPTNMVHGRLIRPPAPRAQLISMETGDLSSMPGFIKIVCDGNFVAVLAEREGQARTIAALLKDALIWSYPEDLRHSGDPYLWLKSAPARTETVTEKTSDSMTNPEGLTTYNASYQRPYQCHASISPSAAIALFENNLLTIWSHAQGMYPLREAIAHTLNLELSQVRCIHREASGCYGHNGADDAACDAAALALQVPGKAVRLQWERGDEFCLEPLGSAMHIEIQAQMDQDAKIRNWDYDLWSCTHSGRPTNAQTAGNLLYAQQRENPLPIPPARSIPQPNGGSDRNAVPLYDFESMRVHKHLVTETPLRTSALRGLGAYANVFAIDSFMDELAFQSHQDPIEFRLRHLQDKRAIAVLNTLKILSNWDSRPAPKKGEGWGVGFARFKNLSSYLGLVCKLSTDSDSGKISLEHFTAVCDAGLVINPDGVRAQIEGGIIQSSSWTLKEQVQFNQKQVQSVDWASYPILRFDEIPDIDVFLIDSADKSLGVGETAQGPTAAAIANAVFHATGNRLRQLPLTL